MEDNKTSSQQPIKVVTKQAYAEKVGYSLDTLKKLIENDSDLLRKLEDVGYVSSQKGFTPKQQRILNDFFL